MSAYPQFQAATPRVTRMEMADLYVGDRTTVIQLDAVPCEAWIQNLRALTRQCEKFSGVEVEVNGEWVHFVGTRKGQGPVAGDLLKLVAAAGEMAYLSPAARPVASQARPTLAA